MILCGDHVEEPAHIWDSVDTRKGALISDWLQWWNQQQRATGGRGIIRRHDEDAWMAELKSLCPRTWWGGGDTQMTELAGKCYDETEEYFLLSRQGCVCSPLVYQPNTLTWTTPASIPNVDGHYT